MNREIKFRAWNKNNNQFHTWGALQHVPLWDYLDNPTYELQQFTGLKDKNGKDIYEGDFVRHRKLNRGTDMSSYGLAETMINDESREVKYENYGFSPFAGWINSAQSDLEWEIIGNIYESPELFKV